MAFTKNGYENQRIRQMHRVDASDIAGVLGGVAFGAAGLGFIMAVVPGTTIANIITGDKLAAAGIVLGLSAFGVSKLLRK